MKKLLNVRKFLGRDDLPFTFTAFANRDEGDEDCLFWQDIEFAFGDGSTTTSIAYSLCPGYLDKQTRKQQIRDLSMIADTFAKLRDFAIEADAMLAARKEPSHGAE